MLHESWQEIASFPKLGETTGRVRGGVGVHFRCWLGLVAQWLVRVLIVVAFWWEVVGVVLLIWVAPLLWDFFTTPGQWLL